MSITRHHQDWMSLVEHSGPFLSFNLIKEIFPQGLEKLEPELWSQSKLAYTEWREAATGTAPDLNLHQAWISYVLNDMLGYASLLVEQGKVPDLFAVRHHQSGERLQADRVLCSEVQNPTPDNAQLLIQALPPKTGLERASKEGGLSPASRMIYLLHAHKIPLGLVTNGEQWMFVFAVPGESTGIAVWNAGLWVDERVACQSFISLFRLMRFTGVEEDKTISSLFERSRDDQLEVTKQLGDQVRRAVEILIHNIDKIDRERERKLLQGFDEKRLYNAALTLMMRLVFLFSAEERKILLPDLEEFQEHYGILGLYDALRELADKNGEEVLERRHDAWVRLLATFRAIHGGIQHPDFCMPAYGGTLFDPDRYPFLEGRIQTESGVQGLSEARPLPIDNRTVMYLLQSLQFIQYKLAGGNPIEARRLSFRALSVEQIGHVYEGLLDHTGCRADENMIGLDVNKGRESLHSLKEIEKANKTSESDLIDKLHEMTGKAKTSLKKMLDEPDKNIEQRLGLACDNDQRLINRIRPYSALLELDAFGNPIVIAKDSVYVGEGTDRRSSGTHYTPRSLTEPIVRYTLEPLVFTGPAEGVDPKDWQLKTADEILALKVCDPAMGSGAFLVQACRYLATHLREAWMKYGAPTTAHPTLPFAELPEGELEEEFLAAAEEEQRIQAMRLIAERCLYGVDINPMAVEMAKLSLWLETAQKNRPFSFLDHALKCGDSLLGVGKDFIDELINTNKKIGSEGLYDSILVRSLTDAARIRRELEELDDSDITVIHQKETLLERSQELTTEIEQVALYMTGALLQGQNRETLLERASAILGGSREVDHEKTIADATDRKAFIWFVQFPEVFDREESGFDGIIGNPPFVGGQRLTGNYGEGYREYLVNNLGMGKRGSADLCAYFFLRNFRLLKPEGLFGLLATNTIAQGDTREVGLDQILEHGGKVIRANPNRPWPGVAGVHVAAVWIIKSDWQAQAVLEKEDLSTTTHPTITSYLTPPGKAIGKPHQLKANEGKSFQGSIILGLGFTMSPEEASEWIKKDSKNKDVIFPYLNGKDLNSHPGQEPSRWVINFFDWPLDRSAEGSWFGGVSEEIKKIEIKKSKDHKFNGTPSSGFTFYNDSAGLSSEAKDARKVWLQEGRVPSDYPYPVAVDYPDMLTIVEEKVKPERQKKHDDGSFVQRKPLPQKWWIYAEKRPAMYAAIAGMERVLVRSRVSKTHALVIIDPQSVYSEATVCLILAKYGEYAFVQSSLHEYWAWEYAGALKSDLRYSPSDCFDTFPFPEATKGLDAIGERFYQHRQSLMQEYQIGLTSLYNRLHDPEDEEPGIVQLRELQIEMDNSVRDAYGWSDLELDHGFHETKQGLRFTLSEPARLEVLDRLLELNHERYAEEVKAGLHEKKDGKKKKGKAKKKDAGDGQRDLF